MTFKRKIMLSVLGMVVSFILCVLSAKSDTWFTIAFVLFLANFSMFYMILKTESLKGRDPH